MITKKKKREELQLLRDEALDAYLNREDFQYDVNADALYRQYKDTYTDLGKKAMEDTMGQASALTGGYGSSYAQNVGQQAYQNHLSRLDDVIPELYQLAYERYQDQGQKLYKTYQSWADLEQQAAQQEQWEQEYELEERKRQDAYNRFLKEQEYKNSQLKTSQSQTVTTELDYRAMPAYPQKLDQPTAGGASAVEPQYDNEHVSTGNIKTMQRLLGLPDTGKWTELEQQKAGNLRADAAWQAYQQGELQSRSRSGMSMDEWTELKKAQTANTPVTMIKTQQTEAFVDNTDSWETVARSGNGYENYEEYLKTRIDSALSKGQLTSGEAAWLINYYTPDMGESMSDQYTSDRFKQLQKQVMAQLAADVDESYIESFLMDAREFVLQTEADIRTLTWTTATSDQALNKRNASAQAIKDRANKVRAWLDANKSRISQDAYQQYIQYLDDFSVFLDQSADTYKKSRAAFSRFATEEDYNKAVARQQWQSKYGTMSFEQIKNTLETLPDGDEKEWLKAYAPSVMTAEDYDNEIEEVEAELRTMNAVLEEYDFCRLRYSTADPNSYANVRLNELRQQYGSKEDIENKIEELEAAKWGYENGKKYNLLYLNADYASESTKIADTPTAGFGINAFDKWYGQGDEVYDYINDIDGSRKRIRQSGDKNDGDAGYYHLSFMSKDEIANYNYLYNVSGRKAANEYLAYLKNDLTQRRQAEIAETHQKLATEHPGWADLYSVGATLASGIGLLDIAGQNAVKGIKEAITGEYAGPINYSSAAMNPNTIATSIRSTRAQNIADKYGVIDINAEDHPFWAKLLNGKSFGDVYQLGMSMADSAAVLAMSPILGSYGTVLLGGSAGTQGVINALENGATDEQALAMGVLNGFFEMFFEKFSLETLLSSNGRRFIDALWRQAVAEGSEELFTSAANNVADIIVMAEKSGYMKNVADYIDDGFSESEAMQKALLDMGIDMGWDFVGGLISGGIMGGGGKVASNSVQQLENYKTGKNILSTDGGVDALLNSADQVRSVSSAQMQSTLSSQIDKVNQKPTARNVGQLNATVQAANSRVNASVTPEDVTNMLKSKRVDSKTAAGITDAIVARLNGQELTRTQRERLSSSLDSPTVQSVISKLMKKKSVGIDSTLKNAYDEINTIGGNKNGRETTLWNLSNQRADGSLSGSRGGTRATNEDGSGVPGTLGENGGIFKKTLPTARRGLTSDIDAFSDGDYATVTEGSSLHQVQNAFKEEYGIECYIIKNSSWTRSSPAYSRNGIVYIREDIDPDTLSTAVPHEATHVMKQQNFQPYIDFITNTPDWLNFRSETVQKFLKMITDHIKIDPFTANNQQLFRYYDELNSTVYGLYKSGVLDSNEFDFREYIPGAFNDFTSYIQELDRIHEQFRNRRNASGQAKVADGGADALMNLANEVVNRSSAQMQSTLTNQIDKVRQNPTARNVGQLNATVQAANNQAKTSVGQSNATTQAATNQTNTSINQADVAKSLKGKGIPTQKVDTLAGAIVARVNGQELTRTQRDILRSELGRPPVQKVINELIQKKARGVDSTQNRMYDERNRSSLKNGKETALRDSSSLEVLSTVQQRGVTSETAVLGDTSVAEDSPIYQERNALPKRRSRGDKDAKKPYATSRPSYGKGQIEQVWENAKDPITGKVYDPSGVEITWDPTKPRNGQWDMGHMPDAKYSVMHKLYMDDLMSLNDFLAWYRNPANYRPELPSTNRSHKYE